MEYNLICPNGDKQFSNKKSYSNHIRCCINNLHPSTYKGDNVGYGVLHKWVRTNLGELKKCDNCGTTEAKKFEWANISGEYKRDLSDWERLCTKCHMIKDGRLLKFRINPKRKLFWIGRKRDLEGKFL